MTYRRTLLVTLAVLANTAMTRLHAQEAAPMPVFSGANVMQSLYGAHLPHQARLFLATSETLLAQTRTICDAPENTSINDVHAQWLNTLLAWERLTTPALGPVLTRRSQRSIDFSPTRLPMLTRALALQPQALADMGPIGTPAKGLPAMEHLLRQAMSQRGPVAGLSRGPLPHCRYLSLLAEEISNEAHALQTELQVAAKTDWATQPEVTHAAMQEWLNQWLAGTEKLRWAEIEKPVREAQTRADQTKTTSPQAAPAFAPRFTRQSPTHLVAWRTQWTSLLAQARLEKGRLAERPMAGQTLIPIDALLLSKGHLALTERWHKALDQVDAELALLTASSSDRALLSVAQALKKVTLLFQTEVASALDIPLGFSDADGD